MHGIFTVFKKLRTDLVKKIVVLLFLLIPLASFGHSGGVWIANDGCGHWFAIVFHYHNNSSATSISATARAGMYIDFDQNGVFDVNGVQYAYTNAAGFTTSNGDFTRFTDWINLTDKSVQASAYANDASIKNEVLSWLNANKNYGRNYSLSVAITAGTYSSTWYEALVCPIKPLSPGVYKASTSTSSAVETPVIYTNPFDLTYSPTNFTGTVTTQSSCGDLLKVDATLTQTCVEEYGLVYSITNNAPTVGGAGVTQQSIWSGAGTDYTNLAFNYTINAPLANEYKTYYIRSYYKQNVAGTLFYVYSPMVSATPIDPALDCDGDGIINSIELTTTAANKDTDGDGTPDYRDLDSDNDGGSDNSEGGVADCDSDGTKDFQDLSLIPAFQTQPVDKTICSSTGTTFSVAVSGGGLSYQWQVNNGNGFANIANNTTYSGATTNTLTLTNAAASLAGYVYRCVVNSSTCSTTATSNTATLTINVTASPAITNAIYEQGATAQSLSSNVTGTSVMYYSQAIGGIGSSTAPTPSTATVGVQEYWVTQTLNGCESERTKVTVTVSLPNEIAGSSSNKASYFPNATAVDDQIVISGGGTITNPKVYIATGFQSGDVLNYSGALPSGITKSYNTTTGTLTFTGSGNAAAWQSIFRAVTFQTSSGNTADRVVNFVLGDAVSLTVNGKPHYYQYISGSTTWSNAKTNAATKTLFGLTGYLATITSQEENDFIKAKLQSDGWVGGSDDYAQINAALGNSTFANQTAAEGKWYWVTGPEKGTPISTNNTTPSSVNGAFMFWNPNEPNNVGGEHYMQLYSSQNGRWNDLGSANSLSGYVAEFGGYGTDPVLKISHTRTLNFDAKPTVSLASSSDVNINQPFTVTITFSEAVTGFDVSDIAVTNSTKSNFTAVNSSVYTVMVTPTSEGEVRVSLAADVCVDGIGTGNTASSALVRQYDATKPTVVLTTGAPNPLNQNFTVTFTFSEAVTGFSLGDITVTNGNPSSFGAISSTTYTATITPIVDGDVKVEVAADVATDVASNGNTASSALTRQYDITRPVVVLSTLAATPTNQPFTVKATFSEAVTNFDAADFTVTNGVASSFVAASNTEYTILITPATDGSVTVQVPVKAATDAATNMSEASAVLNHQYDATKPTVTLATSATASTNAPYTVTFTFGEAVTGFDVSDIAIGNGSASSFTAVSGSEYSALIIPTSEGEVTVEVSADVAIDAASNGNTVSTKLSRTYDVTHPAVALSTDAALNTNANFNVSLVFSEPVTGFNLNDINVTNGVASSFTAVDATTYTVLVAPSADGLVAVDVAADMAHDAAANGNKIATTLTRTYDATKPTVTLSSVAPDPTNGDILVTFTFSEDVTGFDVTDVNVSNGTTSSFTAINASEYSVVITPVADGEVEINVSAEKAIDVATNGNTISNTITRQFDATKPTIILSTSAPSVTNQPYTVTFSFSEHVTGFDLNDVIVANGTASSFEAVNAKEYSALVTPDNDGVVTVEVPVDAAFDAAVNGNEASISLSREYDITLPILTLSSTAAHAINEPFTVTITFSEDVTGFDLSDVVVTNGAASSMTSISGSNYTVVITPATNGEVALYVAENSASDTAGNNNAASTSLTREYDVTLPTVAISSSTPNPTNGPIELTITFSEDVDGFELSDLPIINGTGASFVKVSGTEYTVIITPLTDGEVRIELPANVAQDAATNSNAPATSFSRIYDGTLPVGYEVEFEVSQVNVNNVDNVSFQVSGAEAGTTLHYTIQGADGSTVQGTASVVSGVFDIDGLDLSGLPDGPLTLSFYLQDEAGNIGQTTTTQVMKVTRNIVSVTAPDIIHVPIRTAYAQVALPMTVEVTYSTNEKQLIQVSWSQADYNGLVAGEYQLPGELILAAGTTNLNNLGTSISVVVDANIAPTAITLSNHEFAPSITPEEVIGSFATTDVDDTEFVYELISGTGDQHNALFSIDGEDLRLVDNHNLSGISSFSIRVKSTDPYGNSVEAVFTLTKTEHAQLNIHIPNTFSPNGDGVNDTWIPSELRFYNDVVVEVFDRSGVPLFKTTNPEMGWDGRVNGSKILEGPFFYIIHINDLGITKKGVLITLK